MSLSQEQLASFPLLNMIPVLSASTQVYGGEGAGEGGGGCDGGAGSIGGIGGRGGFEGGGHGLARGVNNMSSSAMSEYSPETSPSKRSLVVVSGIRTTALRHSTPWSPLLLHSGDHSLPSYAMSERDPISAPNM